MVPWLSKERTACQIKTELDQINKLKTQAAARAVAVNAAVSADKGVAGVGKINPLPA